MPRGLRRWQARLLQHVAHLGAGGDDMVELGIVVDRQVLQLPPHARGRLQHHHRAHRGVLLILVFQINRRDVHQEVLTADHHPFGVRSGALAFQPAAEVIAADQSAGGLIADLVLAQAEQRLGRRVGQLDLAFHVDREHRFRHRFQQRAQGAVLAFGRHEVDGAHVGNAGDATDLRHQRAESVKIQLGEIEVNAADGIDFDAP